MDKKTKNINYSQHNIRLPVYISSYKTTSFKGLVIQLNILASVLTKDFISKKASG